jgi:hypothetical protein
MTATSTCLAVKWPVFAPGRGRGLWRRRSRFASSRGPSGNRVGGGRDARARARTIAWRNMATDSWYDCSRAFHSAAHISRRSSKDGDETRLDKEVSIVSPPVILPQRLGIARNVPRPCTGSSLRPEQHPESRKLHVCTLRAVRLAHKTILPWRGCSGIGSATPATASARPWIGRRRCRSRPARSVRTDSLTGLLARRRARGASVALKREEP